MRITFEPIELRYINLDNQMFHSLVVVDTASTTEISPAGEEKHTRTRRSSQHEAVEERKRKKRQEAAGLREPHARTVVCGLPGLNTVELSGLRDGVLYEFRTRITTINGYTTEWSKVCTHEMHWITKEIATTDAEKGPVEFLNYPHADHPRCILCFRPGKKRWFYISTLNTCDHTVTCADSIGTY